MPLPCEKIYITSRFKVSAADVHIGKYGVHLCSCSVPIFEGFFNKKVLSTQDLKHQCCYISDDHTIQHTERFAGFS